MDIMGAERLLHTASRGCSDLRCSELGPGRSRVFILFMESICRWSCKLQPKPLSISVSDHWLVAHSFHDFYLRLKKVSKFMEQQRPIGYAGSSINKSGRLICDIHQRAAMHAALSSLSQRSDLLAQCDAVAKQARGDNSSQDSNTLYASLQFASFRLTCYSLGRDHSFANSLSNFS